MSDDPTYRKARAALREAQAQAQIAMSELRLRVEFYDELAEALRLLDVVHAELVMSLPAVRAHLELLDAANDASRAGMRPYVSIEDEGLKPGGIVASPGKSVIIDGGDEGEWVLPVDLAKWWNAQGDGRLKIEKWLDDGAQTVYQVMHEDTGLFARGSTFGQTLRNLRDWLRRDVHGNLRYFYETGPVQKMTHYGCGGNVLYIQGAHICDCGMQDEPKDEEQS